MNVKSFHTVPTVIEQTTGGERVYDLWSRLMCDRVIFLGTEITDEVANTVVAQLLFLASQDPEKPINMYINSPGGLCTAGLAIYDTMQYILSPIATTCIGQAASMAAVLLAGGSKGHRSILPSAKVMIHQPAGGAHGQVTDVEIVASEMLKTKNKITQILSFHTGQEEQKIKTDCERDYYLSAHEAKAYGIVDHVIEPNKK